MKRFAALLRETWWLWLALSAAGTVLSILVSPVFLVTFPISAFAFVYFGIVRYDDEGHLRQF